MKFAAVVLLACVAVSSAAFTGSLVKEAQPAIDQFAFQLRLATSTKTAAIPHLKEILDHVLSSVGHIIANADNLLANLQGIVAKIQPLVSAAFQEIANGANVLKTLSTLHDRIHAELGIRTKGVISNVGQAIDFIINQLPAVIAQVQAAIAQQVTDGIANFQQLLENAINAVLSSEVAQQVIALLNMLQNNNNNRGFLGDLFGNIWGTITGTIGNVAQNVAQQLQQQLTAALGQMATAGAAAAAQLQIKVRELIEKIKVGMYVMSANAAAALLEKIEDWQEYLGPVFGDLVEALQTVCNSGQHTVNANCQPGSGAVRAF